jgi:hypothetical protein
MLFEGAGPALFKGWAKGGEVYRCSDNGCDCGFTFVYERGDPMGYVRKKSLIQLLAYSEDQTENVYGPMKYMVTQGPLSQVLKVREWGIRGPNGGKIEPVTSKMQSRIGQPVDSGLADESGLMTDANKVAKTWRAIRRGIAGMSGRSIEMTNPWDPAENSAAQAAFESKRKDIFRYYRKPPANLKYSNARDRHKIHVYVYADAPWVLPESIDAEAAETMEIDPTEAERFFGNKLVQGKGAFLPEELVEKGRSGRAPIRRICIGFDGSSSGDWTAIRAEDATGLRFTPTYTVGDEERPTVWKPSDYRGGRIPRTEVRAAIASIYANWDVQRGYFDPRDWQTEIDEWALTYGEDRVVQWPTGQIGRMFDALNRYGSDMVEGLTVHGADAEFETSALNAIKVAKPGDKFILGKPADHQKIDVLMADVLAHEAAADARAEGWTEARQVAYSAGFGE